MSSEPIKVDNLTAASELAALVANPAVPLDVTDLDLGLLPEHVNAILYTEATEFIAPQLKTSGDIYATNATTFSASQLQTSGHILASIAIIFSVPKLQTSGNIYASSVTEFSA